MTWSGPGDGRGLGDERAAHDERWMGLALREAEVAREAGEVPIGCVVVHEGRVIGRGWNQTETHRDPTAHAEMLAITAAAATLGYARLTGARAYVTVEPCVMCAGALLLARVAEVVYGAPEPKFGALGSRLRLQDEAGFNHRFEVRAGVRAEESAALLRDFFRSLRRAESLPRSESELRAESEPRSESEPRAESEPRVESEPRGD